MNTTSSCGTSRTQRGDSGAPKDGLTALHLAACQGHKGVVRMLLENGVGYLVVPKDGCSALHEAVAEGHKEEFG